jgi:hypothetical protein
VSVSIDRSALAPSLSINHYALPMPNLLIGLFLHRTYRNRPNHLTKLACCLHASVPIDLLCLV